jgi:hypothetical protein
MTFIPPQFYKNMVPIRNRTGIAFNIHVPSNSLYKITVLVVAKGFCSRKVKSNVKI